MPTRWRVAGEAGLEAVLREAARVLAEGGLVAYPTDTLYGLAVHPWQPSAVRRLFDVKGRDADRASPLIAADEAQVETALGVLSPLGARLARAFWPGPLTLIVTAPATLPAELLGGRSSVAVRVPAHAVARGLARALGAPVTATSANLSGWPPTADPDQVLASLGDRIDGLVDDGRTPGGLPSTIVDVREATPRLVRAGVVPWDRVVQFLAP